MNSKNIESSKQTFLEKLNEHLKLIEDKTKIKTNKFFTILAICLVLIWTGIYDIYISYLVTIFFPSRWTLREIQKKELDGAKQWLTYWVIFAIFVLIDMISPYLREIVPFYIFLRTIILLWLYLPNFNGAVIVYNTFILEILKHTNNFALLGKNDKNKLLIEVEEILQRRIKNSPSGSMSIPNLVAGNSIVSNASEKKIN